MSDKLQRRRAPEPSGSDTAHRYRLRSLKHRLAAGLLLCGLFSGLLVTINAYWGFINQGEESLLVQANETAQALSQLVQLDDGARLQEQLSILASGGTLHRIDITQRHSSLIFASSLPKLVGTELTHTPTAALAHATSELRLQATHRGYQDHGVQHHDYVAHVPITLRGEHEALLHLYFHADKLVEVAREEVLSVAIPLLLAILLLGLFGYLWVARYVLRPVSEIALALHQRASGDSTARLPRFTTQSEISDLATGVGETLNSIEQARQRYHAILNTAADAIITTDPLGRIESVNPAAEGIFGYRAAEAIGMPVERLMPSIYSSDSIDELMENFSQQDETAEAGPDDAYGLRRDGSRFDLEVAISETAAGEHHLFTIIARDVSERRRAERALYDSERKYRSVFDASTVGVAMINPAGQFIDCNQAWPAMLGYSRDEMLKLSNLDITHPDDRPHTASYTEQLAITNTRRYRVEKRYLHREGHVVWGDMSIAPVFNRDGELEHLVGVIRDITERKQAELALRESEQRFKDYTEVTADWFWETDAELCFSRVDGDFERITGVAAEAVLGKRRDQLTSGPINASMQAHMKALHAHEAFRNFEYSFNINGRTGHVSISGKPLFDPAGTFLGFRGTATDITRRKAIEVELQAHREHLQELVDERTEELSAAVEEARRADHSKSEFLANMSHELRTPMHAIISFSRMGLQRHGHASTEKLGHYFSRVNESAERLLSLLNDLLDLSKLEAGQMSLDLRQHSLRAVADTAINEFAAMAAERGLSLQLEADDALPGRFDEARVLQVLRNLLSNAIKFSPAGGPITLQLSTQCDATGQPSQLITEVRDQGVGIPENELHSVFDKFIQSSKTNTGAGGTGLGLAISKEIVEAHGGSIGVRINADQGVTFHFILPAHAADEVRTAERQQA